MVVEAGTTEAGAGEQEVAPFWAKVKAVPQNDARTRTNTGAITFFMRYHLSSHKESADGFQISAPPERLPGPRGNHGRRSERLADDECRKIYVPLLEVVVARFLLLT